MSVGIGKRKLAVAGLVVALVVAVAHPAEAAPAWNVQSTFNEANVFNRFNAVSCASTSSCVATGHANEGGSTPNEPIAQSWNFGWSPEPVPKPSGALGHALTGVSCKSTTCLAVGNARYANNVIQAMVAQRTGSTWTSAIPPLPSGTTFSQLYEVSCSSATACTAVGDFNSGTGITPLVLRWNGSSWTRQIPKKPAGAASFELTGVHCVSGTSCLAVGAYLDAADNGKTLIEKWNGTAWNIQASPNVTGATTNSLRAVACSAANACTAVGLAGPPTGPIRTLALRWNGSAWSRQTTPNRKGPTTLLSGVACPSSTACVAVGLSDSATEVLAPLAARWNGSSWVLQATPLPVGHTQGILSGVACPGLNLCFAVGSASDATHERTFALRYS